MEQEKLEKLTHDAEECPITAMIDVIGGKWKPPIIWLLMKGPLRFGEISRIIPGMALKVLSRTLKELEGDGVIISNSFPEIPPRVEYALSEKGESLQDIMHMLSDWSRAHVIPLKSVSK